MGGSGSGSWYRHSKKSTTSDYSNFIMKRLVEEGVVKENQYRTGSWQWLRNGEITSSVSYIADTNNIASSYIQLKYRNTNSQEDFDYKIRLTTTRPHYGGTRWWFICPAQGCGRRVSVLYGGKIFACRHCYNIAYDTQNEAPYSRILTKAQKIHRKLGGSGCTGDWVKKPKYMHQKTYDRLVNEMENYEQISLMGMAARFGILDRL